MTHNNVNESIETKEKPLIKIKANFDGSFRHVRPGEAFDITFPVCSSVRLGDAITLK